MGANERELIDSWAEQLAAADDPVEVWYEQILSPDVDYRAIEGAPDDVGPIIGRDAMRDYLSDWYEMFGDFTVSPEELIEAGPGRVIVVWRVGGRAKASGIVTDMRLAIDYVIAHGKVVRGREYLTKEQALAGLAAEGART